MFFFLNADIYFYFTFIKDPTGWENIIMVQCTAGELTEV